MIETTDTIRRFGSGTLFLVSCLLAGLLAAGVARPAMAEEVADDAIEAAGDDAVQAETPETPQRFRSMHEYALHRAQATPTQPADADAVADEEAAEEDPAQPDDPGALRPDRSPFAGAEGEAEMRLDAADLDVMSEEELAELQALIEADIAAAAERAREEAQTQPADGRPGPRGVERAPRAHPMVPPGQQPADAAPSRRARTQPPGRPGATPPATELPPEMADTERFRLLPEERPYFFSWHGTPFDKVLDDLQELTGMSLVGRHTIQQPTPPRSLVTFESVRLMDFDEALTTINEIVMFDLNLWIVRRGGYLMIRELSEWYRQIPPRLMFNSLEAYREADLPLWEVAMVAYTPRHKPAATLAQGAMDIIPLNGARATLISETNQIQLMGFVYFIERQLQYFDRMDQVTEPYRVWREYPLEYATAEEAAAELQAMVGVDIGEPGMAQPRPPRTTPQRGRGAAAQPQVEETVVGSDEEDVVDIQPIRRRNSLRVRATPARHEEIEEYLASYIDVRSPPENYRLVRLKYADPVTLKETIEPMLGTKEWFQPPTPQPRGNQPQPAAPPPVLRQVGTTAVMQPVPSLRALMVKAEGEEMEKILAYIDELDVPEEEASFTYIRLEHANASALAQILNTALGGGAMARRGARGPAPGMTFSAIADTSSDRAIVVQGDPKQLDDARQLVAQLDVDPLAGAVQEMIQLENVVPTTLANILRSRYAGGPISRFSPGPTLPNFIADDMSKTLIVVCKEQMWPEIKRLIGEIDSRSEIMTTTKLYPLEHADVMAVAPVLTQALGGSGPRGMRSMQAYMTQPTFHAHPQNNALVVTATSEAHEEVANLLAELDQPSPADGAELRAIQLTNADVDYVAEKVMEVLQPAGTGGRTWGGRGGFNPYGMGTSGRDIPVRVIPEPVTNRLLVMASDEDFARAEELAMSIDGEYADKEYVRRIFQLEHVSSTEVEQAIRTVFDESTTAVTSGRGRRGGTWAPTTYGSSTPPTVRTVGTENGLVVIAPKEKMDDVAELVRELDTDRTGDNEIRTWRIEGAGTDGTYQVAQNLEALFSSQRGGIGRGASTRGGTMRFIGARNSETLIVSAPPDRMDEIDGLIEEMTGSIKSESFVIRHFDVRRAQPEDLAELIKPVLQTKHQEMQQTGGRGFSWFRVEPQVTPHRTARRLMVSAPESLMPLVAELIHEFDQEGMASVTRFIRLETAKASEIAPIIERQMGDRSGGRAAASRSWWMPQPASTGGDELTATPVDSSNMILLRGPEGKVHEAEQLIATLDREARPEGPVIESFTLKYADVYEVTRFLEDFMGGGETGVRGQTGGGVVMRPNYTANRIVVSAPYERIPRITRLIEMKEAEAYEDKIQREMLADASAGATGRITGRDGRYMTKEYDMPEGVQAIEEVARMLSEILEQRYGYFNAPWVRSFPLGRMIVVEAKPEQFREVENWLDKILEQPPTPRPVLYPVRVPAGATASEVVNTLLQMTPGDPRETFTIRELGQRRRGADPERMVKEIRIESLNDEAPFVPTGALREIQAALASLSWLESATVTATQPAEADAPATQPADADTPATRPAAEADPVTARLVEDAESPPSIDVLGPVGVEDLEVATAGEDAVIPEAPVPAPVAEDRPVGTREALMEAALELQASERTQILYDDEQGVIYFVGRRARLEQVRRTLEDIIEQYEDLRREDERPIRIFEMRNVDVNVAAMILEQMFGPQAVAARAQRQQQRQPRQQPEDQAARGDEGEDGPRRRREEEQQAMEQEALQAAMAAGEQIRVVPDVRTRTVIVRAPAEMFPQIIELLAKIDREGVEPPMVIKVFQLERLNALEVERAIKSILKIEDPQMQRLAAQRGRTARRPGDAGAAQQAELIEQLQTQMLEMQQAAQVGPAVEGDAEGRIRLNPARDITLTSDARTNTIIAAAPKEGMQLVEDLIEKLEEQEIPIQVETVRLENAEAVRVAAELEKIFQATRGVGRAPDGITPSELGDVRIAADARTNTLVISAREPDLVKIKPLIAELDQPAPADDFQLHTVQYGDAVAMASTLNQIFAADTQATGPLAVRITADAETNTIIVRAPQAKQLIIEERIRTLDEKVGVRTTPRQIELAVASATSVAERLREIFVPRGARGGVRREIQITGDDNSRTLFVTAPDEVFRDIEEAAAQLDQASDQDIQVFKLEHAFASDILTTFREMTAQVLAQLRGAGGQRDVFAASADPRTNSLIVTGTPPVFIAVQKVLADLDVPGADTTEVATGMFSLAKANAAAMASTINTLYAGQRFPGGAAPPRAVPVADANVLYVYGTKRQLDEIRTNVIDRYERTIDDVDLAVKDYRIPVEHADVDDAAARLSSWFSSRMANLQAAGYTNLQPAQRAVSIVPDPPSRTLLVSCTEENKALIEEMLETFDIPEATDRGQQLRVFPIQFADLWQTVQALNTTFRQTGRVPPSEQVSISAESGTQSIIVKAPAEIMKEIEDLIQQIDRADADRLTPPQTIRLDHARASETARTLNEMIRQTMRRDRTTGTYPVSVSANDASNTLLIAGTPRAMDEIRKVIEEMDVEPPIDDEREVKSYALQFADLNSVIQAITARFEGSQNRPIREQVSITPDRTNNTLLVTASPTNHDRIEQIVKDLDQSDVGDLRAPETVRVEHVRPSELAETLNEMIRATKRPDRRTNRYPVTVSANDAAGMLLVSALTDEAFEEIRALIAQLDVPMETEDDRVIRPYAVEYADLTSIVSILRSRFETSESRAVRDQVTVVPVAATGSVVVTASLGNHEKIQALLHDVDVSASTRRSYPIRVTNVDADEVARTLTAVYRQAGGRSPAQFTASPGAGQVVVTATEAEIDGIRDLIRELDQPESIEEQRMEIVPVRRIAPTEMRDMLTQFVQRPGQARRGGALPGDLRIVASTGANAVIITGPTDRVEELKALAEQIDSRAPDESDEEFGRQVVVFALENAEPRSVASVIASAFGRRGAGVSESERVDAVGEVNTGTVIVTATADRIEKIRAMIEDLDQESSNVARQEVIPLVHAQAEDLAPILTQTYRFAGQGRAGRVPISITADASSNALVLSAGEADLRGIRETIERLDQPDTTERDVRVIRVQRLAADEIATALTEYAQRPGQRGRRGQRADDISVTATSGGGTVVLAGPRDRLDELENLAERIDAQAPDPDDPDVGRQVVVMPLENADPRSVASVIGTSFGRTGRSVPEAERVDAVGEVNTNTVVVTATAERIEKIRAMVRELDQESSNVPKQEVIPLTHARAEDLAAVLTQTYRFSSRGRAGGAQIVIAADAGTNALVVSAGEADLRGIRDTVEHLDRPATLNVEELRIIPLEHIDATETMEIMAEYLRKPGPRRGRGAGDDLIGDVRIQASPTLNALIVSGSTAQIDLVQERVKSIDKKIDGAGTAPRIIELEHAIAAQLASTLTRMFTEPAQQARGRQNPEMVPLIMADESSNALVVRARTVDYNLIADMVEKLDREDARPGGIEVIPVDRGVDVQRLAMEIERTINAGEQNRARQQPGYRAGQVSIGVDTRASVLMVAGSPELFPTVANLVESLRTIQPAGTVSARIVPTRNLPANEVKRVLDQLLEQDGAQGGRATIRRR